MQHNVCPEIVDLLRDIRNHVYFHDQMGITGYPASEPLRHFLGRKIESSQPSEPSRRPVPSARPIPQPSAPISAPPTAPAESLPRPAGRSLASIDTEIIACDKCPLCRNKQGSVTGRGSEKARLMFIGDWSRQTGPFTKEIIFGREEDAMLARMIAAINLQASETYITNCLKCCPVDTYPPADECEKSCAAYLESEIAAIRPTVICTMGETATRVLLKSPEPLFRLRGRFHEFRIPRGSTIQVMPTFHPGFLVRHVSMKKATWQDLQRIQQVLAKG